MIILPDDLPDYTDEAGKPFDKDSFPLVEAVRMSMSYPFLFTPVVLHREGRPVYVVDGGLLSNFPIWLFDSPNPKRPTWGFRLHGGSSVDEGLPYRKIPRPLWAVPLLKAMFSAATKAWDREQMEQVVSARTVSIPTHQISTTDFGLTKSDADALYAWGVNAAHDFFTAPDQVAYLNSFGQTLAPAPATDAKPPVQAEVTEPEATPAH
jgi:NTE family protein